jgi:hypothetical protein
MTSNNSFQFTASSHALAGLPARVTAFCFHANLDQILLACQNRVYAGFARPRQPAARANPPHSSPCAAQRLSATSSAVLQEYTLQESVLHLFSVETDAKTTYTLALSESGQVSCVAEDGALLHTSALSRRVGASRRHFAETRALSFAGLAHVVAAAEVVLYRAAPQGQLKFEFAGGPKKKYRVTAVASAPAGVAAIAVATADAGLFVWRYSAAQAAAAGPEDALKVLSFAGSKELGHVRALAFVRHDRDTLLLAAPESESAAASLWAWRAKAAEDSDGGSLFCVRRFPVHAPGAAVAFHPSLPVCMFVSGSAGSGQARAL